MSGSSATVGSAASNRFRHALPLDRSSMTRWRKRVGAERPEVPLAETLAAAEPRHVERITFDTTVQPKAVIGHMKEVGHLGRNFLAAAGHNLRLLRAWLIRLLAFLLSLPAIGAPAPPLRSAQLAAR
jgi:hypothetical protein